MTAVKWRPVIVFVLLAYALAWLAALPLWLGDGLREPLFPLYAVLMMAAPAAAALATSRFVDRPPSIPRELGLVQFRPAGRFVLFLAAGLVLPVLLALAALAIGALLGVYPADFVGFSGYRLLLAQQSQAVGLAVPDLPIGVLVAAQFSTFHASVLGWSGWIVPLLLVAGLIATGQFRPAASHTVAAAYPPAGKP